LAFSRPSPPTTHHGEKSRSQAGYNTAANELRKKELSPTTFSSLKTLIEGNTNPSKVELRESLLEAVQESVYLEAEYDELKRKLSDMQNEISRF